MYYWTYIKDNFNKVFLCELKEISYTLSAGEKPIVHKICYTKSENLMVEIGKIKGQNF